MPSLKIQRDLCIMNNLTRRNNIYPRFSYLLSLSLSHKSRKRDHNQTQ